MPVLWSMADCLDKLHDTYNERFFRKIYCLALVCEPEELKRRMTEGRGITSEEWLKSSEEYNRYFMEHETIGEISFTCLDITAKSPSEVADEVICWVNGKCKNEQELVSESKAYQLTYYHRKSLFYHLGIQ